jgi:hypothetical protein
VRALLISLKARGLDLNLTAAELRIQSDRSERLLVEK